MNLLRFSDSALKDKLKNYASAFVLCFLRYYRVLAIELEIIN
jgi:hypothetical protein